MFDRIKRIFHKETPKESWEETLRRLGNTLVPVSGEAETLQGELVRCINNLNDEATRNGWMNWDEGDVESVDVLRRYLPDPDVFAETANQQIHKALDTVRHAGERGADNGAFAYDGRISFLFGSKEFLDEDIALDLGDVVCQRNGALYLRISFVSVPLQHI